MILESIALAESFENDDHIQLMTKKLPSNMTMRLKLKLKLTTLPIKTDINKPIDKSVDKTTDKSVEISDIISEDSEFENPNINEDNSEINVDEINVDEINVDENKHDTPNDTSEDTTEDTTDEEGNEEPSTNTDKANVNPTQYSFLNSQPGFTIVNSVTNTPLNTIYINSVPGTTPQYVTTDCIRINGWPFVCGTVNYQ